MAVLCVAVPLLFLLGTRRRNVAGPGQLDVQQVPLGRLHEAPWNANRVNAQTLERIRHSIRDFGVVENLVARPLPDPCPECGGKGHLEVLSGNHRLRIYRDEGLDAAPCHVAKLDDARARLLAQTLNRTRGKDDPEAYAELLRRVLEDLQPWDVTQFLPETEQSIAKLIGDAGADRDTAPPPPKNPVSKPGEIYELGPHRLLCGDALDQAAVDRLLDGAEPTLLVTDPPYGVRLDLLNVGRTAARDRQARGVEGDTRADWSEAFTLAPSLDVAYIWHAGQWCDEVSAGLKATGWEIAQQIIWDKGHFAMGRANYHWQHEACFYAFRVGAEVPWYGPQHVPAFYARKPGSGMPWLGGRDQATVWVARAPRFGVGDETDEGYDHPTQKPVELYARPIRNHLQPDEWLYDPFAGSGTAIIAAEVTGRRCLAIDIDPAFCDVIRQRYAEFTEQPEYAPKARRRRRSKAAA